MDENSLNEIVRKCYLKYLNREPDYAGLEHFTTLMQTNQIDEKSLIDKLKNIAKDSRFIKKFCI